MTQLEDDFSAAALDAVATFGRAATWTQYADSYDTSTGINTRTATAHAVTCTPPTPRRDGWRGAATVNTADGTIYLAADGLGFTPRAGDRVQVGSDYWTVVEVETAIAQTVAVLFSCAVRKGAA